MGGAPDGSGARGAAGSSGGAPEGNRNALSRIRDNPFYVLGLRPTAGRMDIEREGQKLLGMLELKMTSAATYLTPLGPFERTPEKVREAMALLRDPERRLAHELWARLDPRSEPLPEVDEELEALAAAAEASRGEDPLAPWPEALTALGWGAPRRKGPRTRSPDPGPPPGSDPRRRGSP